MIVLEERGERREEREYLQSAKYGAQGIPSADAAQTSVSAELSAHNTNLSLLSSLSSPLSSLLSPLYFSPIQWYQKLNRSGNVLIEQHEHFLKQTYRNRCVIATAQGLQTLSVPVEAPSSAALSKTAIKDVRISDHGKWRTEHWNALQSAYGESPFFEYYEDDIRPFFEQRWTFLLDFNMAITGKMCELLDIHPNISLTTAYMMVPSSSENTDGIVDFRTSIRPKHPLPDADFVLRPYYQVFREKFGFQPNLSVLDLLFNMGNESIFYL